MGLEVVATAAAGAAVGGSIYQAERTREAARQQRRAARAEREARRVTQAQQERERQLAIRQQQRQERIRRAQILSSAEAAGVSGASVEASTIGSGQTIQQSGQAFATGASIAASQVSNLTQKAANFKSEAAFDLAQAEIGRQVGAAGRSAFSAAGGFSAFSPGG